MGNLIGEKIKITKCLHGHEFQIGEIVEIIDIDNDWSYVAKSKSDKTYWITDEEFELIHCGGELDFERIEENQIHTTISRRDYFAAAALQALMTIPDISSDNLAKKAVYWADELIKQLDKE